MTLTFSATDALSGVAAIEYKLNQGAWTTVPAGQPVVVSTVCDYVVSYRSTDAAGNVDKERSTTVSISADITPALKAPNKAKPGRRQGRGQGRPAAVDPPPRWGRRPSPPAGATATRPRRSSSR
ncbi:MAG TPA: hypothetical protein VIU11_00605 [Nakamurella sp.]